LGAPESDAELPKATWFNVPKFPQATFQSSSVKSLGGGKFEVGGKLSIKGNLRDVVIPVSLVQSGATTTASGAFVIKRLAFKIGENEWADTSMVADDVQVKFKLALTGVGKF
jgi:polyisoprenoid-binding protein YceI